MRAKRINEDLTKLLKPKTKEEIFRNFNIISNDINALSLKSLDLIQHFIIHDRYDNLCDLQLLILSEFSQSWTNSFRYKSRGKLFNGNTFFPLTIELETCESSKARSIRISDQSFMLRDNFKEFIKNNLLEYNLSDVTKKMKNKLIRAAVKNPNVFYIIVDKTETS